MSDVSWKTKFKALPNWEKALFIAILLMPLYVVDKGIKRLDFVTSESIDARMVFKTGETAKVGSYARFAMPRIDDPDTLMNVTKRIVCGPGDILRIENLQVYCNGELLGTQMETTPAGYPLPVFSYNGVIPDHMAFAMGDHPASYDSRYWGLIDIRHAERVSKVF